MSNGAVAIPQGATVEGSPESVNPPSPKAASASVPIPQDAQLVDSPQDIPRSFTDPNASKFGYYVDDDHNTIIIPKEGEEYADTVKRAVAHYKAMSPDEQQAAINREEEHMPSKTAKTLAGAAGIGVAGPAMLALPGEIATALPSVLTHTVNGVRAVTAWAVKNPVQAYFLYHIIKEMVPGAKKAIGIVKGAPDVP